MDVDQSIPWWATIWVKATKPRSRIVVTMLGQTWAFTVQSGGFGDGGVNRLVRSALPFTTEWVRHETLVWLHPTAQRVRVAHVAFNHSSGTTTDATQLVAGLRMEPAS